MCEVRREFDGFILEINQTSTGWRGELRQQGLEGSLRTFTFTREDRNRIANTLGLLLDPMQVIENELRNQAQMILNRRAS